MIDQTIKGGDSVECFGLEGDSFITTARSRPMLNVGWCGRMQPWMIVRVDHPGFGHPVNWPAEYVHKVDPTATNPP